MKVEIHIDDDTYALYSRYTSTSRPNTIDAMEHQLERFSGMNPKERWLLVSPESRHAIEHALGDLTIPNAAMLVKRILAHASVTLGKHQINLTANQMKEIEQRAVRNNRDPKLEVERIMRDIMRDYTRAV